MAVPLSSTSLAVCYKTKNKPAHHQGVDDHPVDAVNRITVYPLPRAVSRSCESGTAGSGRWKLGGLTAGAATQAFGIRAFMRKNITIRNGTIRGFRGAIFLADNAFYDGSQGHLVEDIRADKNTFSGIAVIGRGNIVRRNQVMDTGGSTVDIAAYGIIFDGPGGRVLNNDISGTASRSWANAFALSFRDADGAVVDGNRIDDVSADTGWPMGIFIDSSNDVLLAGNHITRVPYGVFYSNSTSKYMDNLTSNVTTPFTGGTDAGGNN